MPDAVFTYVLASGMLLAAVIAWQWWLFIVRRGGNAKKLPSAYRRHRWLGLLPMPLLVLHVGQAGALASSAMGWLLLASALSGVLNPEILRPKTGLLRKTWLVVHVGAAALLVPFILLHVWAAFCFKGP